MDGKIRCPWAGDTKIYIDYHDHEWGRPVHDDRKLFEMLVLEGMQAGLSWLTILKKRQAFRKAFSGFNPKEVAGYDDAKIAELMSNAAIIRNRRKIEAAVGNAKLFLDIIESYGSFDSFLWAYVDHVPITNHWEKQGHVPANTPLAEKISRDLGKLGFKFVGPTIVYSFMQAVGLVNDHLVSCFVHAEISNSGQRISL